LSLTNSTNENIPRKAPVSDIKGLFNIWKLKYEKTVDDNDSEIQVQMLRMWFLKSSFRVKNSKIFGRMVPLGLSSGSIQKSTQSSSRHTKESIFKYEEYS
jgi:hypothetical protein